LETSKSLLTCIAHSVSSTTQVEFKSNCLSRLGSHCLQQGAISMSIDRENYAQIAHSQAQDEGDCSGTQGDQADRSAVEL
jgi:hypothetical protein